MNPLTELHKYGQSIYLDEIRRSWIHEGRLQKLIDDDGLRGVTSNPAIFQKAIANSNDYDAAIREGAGQGHDAHATYETLVVTDIQDAADLFRPMYDASDGEHGYVSLEVSPELAHDEEATFAEGMHLWQRLDRPNVFIKVPATDAGVPAIRRLIGEGVNVNVTLLFGLDRYRQVVDAYLTGLEERFKTGADVSKVASVASFFLSRIDTAVDRILDSNIRAAQGRDVALQGEQIPEDVLSALTEHTCLDGLDPLFEPVNLRLVVLHESIDDAVDDDEGLAGVAPHEGQRLGQGARRAQPVLRFRYVLLGRHGAPPTGSAINRADSRDLL